MTRRLRERLKGDEGFTLVELIIAMLVLAIIIGPITASVIIGLTTTARSEQRVTQSNSAQLLRGNFDYDVQSADTVTKTGSCGAGTALVAMRWTDPQTTTTTKVSYAVSSGALHRYACVGAATRDSVIVRDVSGTPTCTVTNAAGTATPCSDSGNTTPVTVALSITTLATTPGASSTYNVAVVATRRVTS